MFDRLVAPALADAALAHLQQAGVQRGAIAAWLGHNSWDFIATLVACERLGAVLLPLNWRLSAAELARVLQHAGAGHLMGTPEVDALAADVLSRVALQPGTAAGVQDGDLLLVYTSGTTAGTAAGEVAGTAGTAGQPKGAMHTRAGMQANAVAAIAAQGLQAQSRVLSVLPLFHVGGLCIQTLPALAVGAKVLLQPRFEPGAWFDAVEQWRPTTTLLVPTVMKALIDHPRWAAADLSSLAFVNSGSQIVPRLLIEAFHARGVPVAQVYGATETGPVSIVLKPADARGHVGHAGRAALGVQVRLAADGELLLKAPNLMRGYHRQQSRSTDASFGADGWFHTGDLAVQHADGCYEIVGRSTDLIISGGENIHPAEIEQIVAALPGVAACAVVGLPHVRWGEVPVLALVRAPGTALQADDVLQALAPQLARLKWPKRVIFLPALPTTALGKVARGRLREQLLLAERMD
ncbi:MAG: AMP-binding protein [Rubrivivax sp.]|nr:AMP-binding protein [Rubrivivax sp.]